MKNVMIDIETLGTEAGSVILSIGACIFHGLEDGRYVEENRLYEVIDINSQTEAGRVIDNDTLIWWMRQSDEARKVFTEQGVRMKAALLILSHWLKTNAGDEFYIWSNTKMDVVMLEYEFKQHGMIYVPWKYNRFRETKSFKMALDSLIAIDQDEITDFIYGDCPHNADYDAQYQAVEIGMYMDEIDGARKLFYGVGEERKDSRG